MASVKIDELEAALKAAFDRIETFQAELARERLEHSATRRLYRRALEAHAGFLTKEEYRQIRACLSPDGISGERAKWHEQAFKVFAACANLLIKKGERAIAINEKPITREDLLAMKRETTKQRRQKRAKSTKAKPHAPRRLR